VYLYLKERMYMYVFSLKRKCAYMYESSVNCEMKWVRLWGEAEFNVSEVGGLTQGV